MLRLGAGTAWAGDSDSKVCEAEINAIVPGAPEELGISGSFVARTSAQGRPGRLPGVGLVWERTQDPHDIDNCEGGWSISIWSQHSS